MESNEDLDISSRTWNKISSNILKDGYREGASIGRDSFFQKGFDLGYSMGFENGEQIGVRNGALRAWTELQKKKKEENVLGDRQIEMEHPQRGCCIMCPQAKHIKMTKDNIATFSKKFDSTAVEMIIEKQKAHFESCLKTHYDQNQHLMDELHITEIT